MNDNLTVPKYSHHLRGFLPFRTRSSVEVHCFHCYFVCVYLPMQQFVGLHLNHLL